MSYAEEYRNIVKAGRRESKDLGEKAQNAVIDTFALMDKADAEIARLTALLAEAKIEVGLLAAMVPARVFSKKSDAEYIEAMGERALALLAKIGA